MYTKTLTQGEHTRKFSISAGSTLGWEVLEAQDSRVIRQVRYTDWHRVERARTAMALEIEALEREGWRLAPLPQ
jgi:hypothetical protein